jgi:HAD superfamily hydrolase (TIGR01509 family)
MNRLPQAILFDHDGVLVASEPLHQSAWKQLLEELGLPFEEADFRTLIGKTAPQIITSLLDRFSPGWDPRQMDPDQLALRKNDFYLKVIEKELRAYPGVREGLEWLRARGIRTAVVSNAKRRELDAGLSTTGLKPLFDQIISREDVGVAKPDPTPYLFAAAALGVAPENCLAVEDSPPGLEAGLMARIPTAAVLTNFERAQLEQPVPGRPDLKPCWIGGSMAELFRWLNTL